MKITRTYLKTLVREIIEEDNAYKDFFKKQLDKTGKSIEDMSDDEKKKFFNKVDSMWKAKDEKNESVKESSDNFGGWIAYDHKGNKIEITKDEASSLYAAKQLAIKKLKVPKSKQSMVAIKPAYNESLKEYIDTERDDVTKIGKSLGNGLYSVDDKIYGREPYFDDVAIKGMTRVGSINKSNKTISPSHGYNKPHKHGKAMEKVAKKMGYSYKQ